LARIVAVAVAVTVGVTLLTTAPTLAQGPPRILLGAIVTPQREVTLTVSYLDADEAVVPPTASDIQLLEAGKDFGGRLTPLPDESLEIVVILDTRRGDEAFDAMTTALGDMVADLPPSSTVSVVTAGDQPALAAEPGPVAGWSTDDALEGVAPTAGSSVIESFGLALDQFSDDRSPDRRHVVIVFADGYQPDPATVADEVSKELRAEAVDTYVIGNARGYARSTSPFPLPLGTGRRVAVLGTQIAPAAADIALQLRNQYRVTFDTKAPKGRVEYTARVGDAGDAVEGAVAVEIPAEAVPRSEKGTSWKAVAIAVPLLIAAIVALLFIPPRIRRGRARRSASSPNALLVPLDPGGSSPDPAMASAGSRPREGRAPETVSARPMGLGGEQVEGREAVRELLRVGRRAVRGVWMAEGFDDPVLVELAQVAHVPIRRVGVEEFLAAARSRYSEGVLALTSPIPSTPIERLCRPTGAPVSIAVLYGNADPEVLAGLTRAAASSHFSGIVLGHSRTAPVSPTTTALALGAMEHVRFSLVNNLPSSIARLKRLGCVIVGVDPGSATRLGDLTVDLATAPIVLVVGSGGGLDRRLRGRCDLVANIEPTAGGATSVSAIPMLACSQLAALRSEAIAAPLDPR
jgi:23S rRNA (guanosine2251-2'-O)-methyltransferase